MNTLSNFQFHKFNITSPRNFYNSYEFTNRQKSRTNPNGFLNSNNTLNNNRYNNITPTFFSQQIPSKTNMNRLNKLSQDKFPTKKIINTDFESILKFGDSNKIDELLPHMIYNDLSFAKNNHLKLVLSKYQNLLKYLFSQQQNLLNKNNKIETMFNNKNSNLNKKIKQLENEEFKMDSLYKSNKNTIDKLKEKIKNFKNILISSGKGNLIPKNFSKTFNKNGIYRCQICLGNAFNTNEDLQQHYIKEHYNITNKELNTNNNSNGKTDLTKSYLNKKLSIFKNELQDMILKKFQQNNNGQNNISKIKLNSQYNNNNNIKMSNFNLLSNNEETKNINDYLDRLEYEQKEQYAQLNNKISQMKNEVFNELKNLKIKPQITNENNQNKNQEQTNINLNLNNANSQINGNIIGNINNEKIEIPINDEDHNNKKIELNNPQININIPENNDNNKSNFNNINEDLKNTNNNNNFNNDINNNFNTNNNIENKININNNEQKEQINLNPFKSKESRGPENNEEFINSNQPKYDEEGRNNPININININNQENNNNKERNENENKNNNINPSTVKYIDQKNIIEEVSGRKESTMNNLTQNNISNPQNISMDKEEKFFTNTGDSVNENGLRGMNQKLNNKNISHFSFNKEDQEPMEKDEFINKIKERDENVLLDKDKNLSQIEINYDVINVKNENNLEQKKENLIKEQENKYLNDNLQNLEVADYENIIKNIMKDTKEKIGKDKKYKEFFDNLIHNKDLVDLDLLFKDLQISTINTNTNANEIGSKINIANTNQISGLGDSKNISKNISMQKSNNYSRNLDFLERKRNSDFL